MQNKIVLITPYLISCSTVLAFWDTGHFLIARHAQNLLHQESPSELESALIELS